MPTIDDAPILCPHGYALDDDCPACNCGPTPPGQFREGEPMLSPAQAAGWIADAVQETAAREAEAAARARDLEPIPPRGPGRPRLVVGSEARQRAVTAIGPPPLGDKAGVGEWISIARAIRGWTQRELARRLQVTAMTVNRLEKGSRGKDSLRLLAIAVLKGRA